MSSYTAYDNLLKEIEQKDKRIEELETERPESTGRAYWGMSQMTTEIERLTAELEAANKRIVDLEANYETAVDAWNSEVDRNRDLSNTLAKLQENGS
jgi:peptidoglycan hydrolase CwlO-like protein